ncbi:MAG TPA: 4'-phosphopantetheinyl transferase superfamily protein [Chitinophagaceae bacterium]|nr:4'-phosphopantetheinyl transferase superfamily protein [Chitinophagaceae bacterium]
MKSAGNDIVALSRVNKHRTGQFNFYSKILSIPEQELYPNQQFSKLSFVNYVWLLWSVKESSYKYLKRLIPELKFTPTKFVIQQIENSTELFNEVENSLWQTPKTSEAFYCGKVLHESHSFYFRSKISDEWIATVVNDTLDFENVWWGIQAIDETNHYHQSKAAKVLLMNKLNSLFTDNLEIGKNSVGYPVILTNSRDLDIPVSLSHDDRFVAYSFILNPLNNN